MIRLLGVAWRRTQGAAGERTFCCVHPREYFPPPRVSVSEWSRIENSLPSTGRPPQLPLCNGTSVFLSRLTINVAAILDFRKCHFRKWAPSVDFAEHWHTPWEEGIAQSSAINLLFGNFHSRFILWIPSVMGSTGMRSCVSEHSPR